MKVKVRPGRDAKARSVTLRAGARACDALRALGLHPDMYIITRNGTLIPLDEMLKNGEKIEFICVTSNG